MNDVYIDIPAYRSPLAVFMSSIQTQQCRIEFEEHRYVVVSESAAKSIALTNKIVEDSQDRQIGILGIIKDIREARASQGETIAQLLDEMRKLNSLLFKHSNTSLPGCMALLAVSRRISAPVIFNV